MLKLVDNGKQNIRKKEDKCRNNLPYVVILRKKVLYFTTIHPNLINFRQESKDKRR